jgi:pSer/pThr/pTyr-binding forkhead associated (FHA) protein
MRFCRNCGTSLAAAQPGPAMPVQPMGMPAPPPMAQPGGAMAGMPPPGPLVTLMPGQMMPGGGAALQAAAMPAAMQSTAPPGPAGMPPGAAPAVARNASAPVAPQPRPAPVIGPPASGAPAGGYSPDVPPTLPPNTPSPVAAMRAAQAAQPAYVPSNDIPATLPPSNVSYGDVPPTLPPNASAPRSQPAAGGGMITCPRCASATPSSFVYCQNCGFHIGAIAPTNPDNARAARPSTPQPLQPPPLQPQQPAPLQQPPVLSLPVDPGGATIAQQPRSQPQPAAGPQWGTAVLVNRDGSDGERFALTSEATVVGRRGADIAFDEDRFLARQHARLERSPDGAVRVTPMDPVNGVFRKADAPVELSDGLVILVGREVLRFERIDAEERAAVPLVRHGVAVFGSPPREPWGRFVQLIPSGGTRDVRHLGTDEVVLGREEGDIVFRDDQFMSRRHAAVNWDGKRALLTDLGSSNGTFIRVVTATLLKHGDHLRMGDQLLRIELAR